MMSVVTKTLALSLIVLAVFAVYFAIGWNDIERDDIEFGARFLYIMFMLVWPASIPLSLALVLLRRRSGRAAWICGAPIFLASLMGFLVAGIALNVFFIIAIAALSLPAWITLLAVELSQRRSKPPSGLRRGNEGRA